MTQSTAHTQDKAPMVSYVKAHPGKTTFASYSQGQDAPADAQAKLRAELVKDMGDPAIKSPMEAMGMYVGDPGLSLAGLQQNLKKHYEHTGKMLSAVGYQRP